MNTREGSRLMKTSRYLVLTVIFIAGLLSFRTALQFAQPMDPANGKGRDSRPGELQYDRKPEPRAAGVPMSVDVQLAPNRINGRIEKMDAILARPTPTQPGRKQANVDKARAEYPSMGSGLQKHSIRSSRLAASHLHLVLRISEAGAAEVVSATEVPGEAVISDAAPGDFVYEIMEAGRSVAIHAFPDPFEIRSFSGPEGTDRQGHHITRAKTATIVVKVPNVKLASPNLNRINIQLYKIRPVVALEKMDATVLGKLKQENQIERRINIDLGKLAPQIRRLGRRLAPQ